MTKELSNSKEITSANAELFRMEVLPEEVRQELNRIFSGQTIPPLYSDIIAKAIFNPDIHPDRLEFLLKNIAQDDTIAVRSSAGNESVKPSIYSKGMVFDISAWLKDNRFSDLGLQKMAQNFIFTRTDLYASNMLLLQYSVEKGQTKGSLSYSNVNEVLVIVLMVKSPKPFLEFDTQSDRYIHRFTTMTADSGLSYPSKAKTIYVQLDKCLEQFKRGVNAEASNSGEASDGTPDKLQLWLSMIADINDRQVTSAAADDPQLQSIRTEARNMAQKKEVQNMLMKEQFDQMDFETYGSEQREEGVNEGFKNGFENGTKSGVKKGERRMSELISELISLGRTEDIGKAAADEQYRETLYREFHIV